MPDTLERDLERYFGALADQLQPPSPTPLAPRTARRRHTWVAIAAAIVVLGCSVAVWTFVVTNDERSENQPVRTETTSDVSPDEPAPPEDASDSPWRRVDGSGLDSTEHSPAAVWMSRDFFVLHAENRGSDPVGARIDPRAGEAAPIPPPPIGWRSDPTVAWTGREVLVVGGASPDLGAPVPVGAAYDPRADAWRVIASPGDLAPGSGPAGYGPGVWTGSRLVFWSVGLAYVPATDTWGTIPTPPIADRTGAASVAIGEDILVWGGCEPIVDCYREPDSWFTDGAYYSAGTGEWRLLPEGPLGGAPFATAVSDGEGATVVGLHVQGDGRGADTVARFVPGEGWSDLPDPAGVPWFGSDVAQVGRAVVLAGPSDRGGQWLVLHPGVETWDAMPAPGVERSHGVVTDGGGHLLVAGGSAGGPPEVLPIAEAWTPAPPDHLDADIGITTTNGVAFPSYTIGDVPPGTAWLSVHVDGEMAARTSQLSSASMGGGLPSGTTVTIQLVAEDADQFPLAVSEPVSLEVP